jgi:hypothetical protein
VRAATADPQANGHARIGPSGDRRKLLATTFSSVPATDSTGSCDFSIAVRPSSAAKDKGARSGRRFAYAYFQNSNLDGVIVPRFEHLFLDCFVQLTKNSPFQGA